MVDNNKKLLEELRKRREKRNNKRRKVKTIKSCCGNFCNTIVILSLAYTGISAYKNEVSILRSNVEIIQLVKSYISKSQVASTEEKTQELYNEIKIALTNNNRLDDVEKEYFLNNFQNIIDEHYKYIDKNKLLNTLSNLDILYQDEIKNIIKAKYRHCGALTQINKSNPLIMVFDSNNIEEVQNTSQEEILNHEFFHVISNGGTYIGKSLEEGLTSQLVYEYFNDKNSYKEETMFAGMITSLVGKDAILEYYYSNDINALINKLSSITGNNYQAIRLISSMDAFCENNYEIIKAEFDKDLTKKEELIEKKYKLLNNILKMYNEYYQVQRNELTANDVYVQACIEYFNDNYDNISLEDVRNDYLSKENNVTYLQYKYAYNPNQTCNFETARCLDEDNEIISWCNKVEDPLFYGFVENIVLRKYMKY